MEKVYKKIKIKIKSFRTANAKQLTE